MFCHLLLGLCEVTFDILKEDVLEEKSFDHLDCSAVITDRLEQVHREIECKGPSKGPTITLPNTQLTGGLWSTLMHSKPQSHVGLKSFHVSTSSEA